MMFIGKLDKHMGFGLEVFANCRRRGVYIEFVVNCTWRLVEGSDYMG